MNSMASTFWGTWPKIVLFAGLIKIIRVSRVSIITRPVDNKESVFQNKKDVYHVSIIVNHIVSYREIKLHHRQASSRGSFLKVKCRMQQCFNNNNNNNNNNNTTIAMTMTMAITIRMRITITISVTVTVTGASCTDVSVWSLSAFDLTMQGTSYMNPIITWVKCCW